MKKKIVIPIVAVLLFYCFFLNYLSPNAEIGLVNNPFSEEVTIQEKGGWHITAPWVFVVRVNTKPVKVSVDSGGHIYTAKLVQFDKKHWREFVELEGWRYYWWSNRFSFNLFQEEHRGLRDIFRGYAFSPNKYLFLKEVSEL